jgi:hypothetical protein
MRPRCLVLKCLKNISSKYHVNIKRAACAALFFVIKKPQFVPVFVILNYTANTFGLQKGYRYAL